MSSQLAVSLGQYSDKGRKHSNQDFHGACIPAAPLLDTKGITLAVADGISSSTVSHIASESAIRSFLEDYYCTPEAWSVKKSAQSVLCAANSWLYSQTRRSQYRYEKDQGYVCTFSALVLKSVTAHVFHVGDARVYRVHGNALEQLTNDHRLWLAQDEHYLSRALGMNDHVELDYQVHATTEGDIFLLATDGIYEYVTAAEIITAIQQHADDLNRAATVIAAHALQRGSADNMTLQLVRIDSLPEPGMPELQQQVQRLLPPALPQARDVLDGYRIVRALHVSSRSHVYLAVDAESGVSVAIKIPSVDKREDKPYLERFLLEDWIAHRINNAHVLRPVTPSRKRNSLYLVTEYIEGQTLRQWMIDNPRPQVETLRVMIEQIARGLQALHRLEMLHQDLRPENIMVDCDGVLRIIDFGAVRVAGLAESAADAATAPIEGTAQYTAPEYFLGEQGSTASDLYSLAAIAYEMLCGQLPYGAEVARTRTRSQQNRLQYRPLRDDNSEVPAWMDFTLRKALDPNPLKRYDELSEFLHDLRYPNAAFLQQARAPLLERNPLAFWRGLSLILGLIVLVLAFWR